MFMQPDPLIQNYNRYGYCFGDPMTCSDPTGYSFRRNHLRMLRMVIGPVTYYHLRQIAETKAGYQIGSIAIAAVSTYCTGAAAFCCVHMMENGSNEACILKKHRVLRRIALGAGMVFGLALLMFQWAFQDMPSAERLRRQLDSAFPAYEEAARICVQYPDLRTVEESSGRFLQPHLRGEVRVEPGIAKRTLSFMANQGAQSIQCGRLYKGGVSHLVSVEFRFLEYRYFMPVRFIALARIFPGEYASPDETVAAEDRIPEHPGWEFFRSQ